MVRTQKSSAPQRCLPREMNMEPVPVGSAVLLNDSSQVHGMSKYLAPNPAGFVAASQFYDYAPAPCVCLGFLVPAAQKKRMYAHIFENRIETNRPISPCCCFATEETCIIDHISVSHFDRLPSRAGMCLCCIPCTCCGPPVIFAQKPMCCCVDMSEHCGTEIRAAPCNFFGLRECIFCCNPCYVRCSVPIVIGVKNPEQFLSAWKFAVDHCTRGERRRAPMPHRRTRACPHS